MSASTDSQQIQILREERKIDNRLQFLKRLFKYSLVRFRGNSQTSKISIPWLIFVLLLIMLGEFLGMGLVVLLAEWKLFFCGNLNQKREFEAVFAAN
jgi:hypothetical protein